MQSFRKKLMSSLWDIQRLTNHRQTMDGQGWLLRPHLVNLGSKKWAENEHFGKYLLFSYRLSSSKELLPSEEWAKNEQNYTQIRSQNSLNKV